MTFLSKYYSILFLECTSLWRSKLQGMQGFIFFLVSILFFPLAIGSNPELLRNVGPGYIWMMAMFASLLSVDSLFNSDNTSGFLEKCLTAPNSLFYYCYSKTLAHWLLNGLPLVIIAPVLGIFYDLPFAVLITLLISLFFGTIILSLFATLAAVLTLPIEQRSLLIPLLVMPLMVPVYILGTLSTYYVMQGLNPISTICLLIAILLVTVLALPFAGIYLLRYGNA